MKKLRSIFLSSIFLSVFLIGCAGKGAGTTTEHSVQARVVNLLREYPDASDYIRHVADTLEALPSQQNLSPQFVRNSIAAIDARNFTTGQFAGRAALNAEQTVRQILQIHYPTADPQKLAAIAAGFRAGVQQF